MIGEREMADAIKAQRRLKIARMLVKRIFAQLANQKRAGGAKCRLV